MTFSRRLSIFLLALAVVTATASAYTISGNQVIEEDAVSKLVVYPHTAWNPSGRNFSQTFELTNKTAADANVFIAYKFDNSLISGSVEYYTQPTYGFVTESKLCAPPLVYDANLNLYPGQRNANRMRCYRVDDRNTTGTTADDRNVLVFDLNFNTYDIPTARIDTDYNRLLSGNTYSSVSNLFSSAGFLNDTIYYLSSPVLFRARATEKWRITYTPNAQDNTKKWEMVFYTGTDASCILFGTCTYVHWLDPWWDTNYAVRYPVNIGNTHSAIDGNYTFALTGFPTTVGNCFDKNSIAVVWSNNSVSTVLNTDLNGTCGGDFNIFWKSKFGIPANTALSSTDSNGYFIYLNSSAITNAARDLNGDGTNGGGVYLAADSFFDADLNRPQWHMNNTGVQAPSTWLKSTGGYDDQFYIEPPAPTNADINFIIVPAKRGVYSAWVKYTVSDTASPRFVVGVFGGAAPGYVNLRTAGNIKYFDSAYRDFSPATSLTLNAWYKIEARYIDGNNLIDYYLYDDHLGLVATALNATTQGSATGTIDRISVENGATTDSKFDKVIARLALAVEPTLTIGAAQTNIGTPDMNLATPNGNNYLSLANTKADGNHSIDFNVTNTDNNYLRIQVYRSATRGAFTTKIIDQNLSYMAQFPNADQNCGAASIDFTSTRQCHIDYNIMYLYNGDGNFFLDLNVATYSTDVNQTDSSLTAFVIDTNKPRTIWDGNAGTWQRTDANVHLTCIDSVGCDANLLFYRIDTNKNTGTSMGSVVLFDLNILFRIANGDGNIAIDFNATDLAGNTSDLNTQYVLLDNTAPILANQLPTTDTSTSLTVYAFEFQVNDGNGSLATSCDYNSFLDNVPLAVNQTGTLSADKKTCSMTVTASPSSGQRIDVNANATDQLGLRSAILKSYAYIYIPSSPNLGGGGGGGGSPIVLSNAQFTVISPQSKAFDFVMGKTTQQIQIKIRNDGTDAATITVAVPDTLSSLNPKVSPDSTQYIEPGQTKEYLVTLDGASADQNAYTGVFTVLDSRGGNQQITFKIAVREGLVLNPISILFVFIGVVAIVFGSETKNKGTQAAAAGAGLLIILIGLGINLL